MNVGIYTRENSKMLEGKAIVSDSDMADEMKTHVLELAYHALDLHEVCDYQQIACFIKQKFDEAYGASWHCVVGDDFSCCITHLTGSFVFFRLEMTAFLVFKDGRDSAQTKQAVGALHPISQ